MRRRCRTGNVRQGGIGGRFCILASEIRTQRGAGNYAGTGVPDIPCRMRTPRRPADVTAWMERVTNRARSEGCRGGARCRWRSPPVFQTPALMRVFPVGPSFGWTQSGQGSPGGVCVLTGGAGHKRTHERNDGIQSVSVKSRGGWTIGSTRPGVSTRRDALRTRFAGTPVRPEGGAYGFLVRG